MTREEIARLLATLKRIVTVSYMMKILWLQTVLSAECTATLSVSVGGKDAEIEVAKSFELINIALDPYYKVGLIR